MNTLNSAPERHSGQRLHHLDLLESIAIFLVLIYHGTLYDWDILKADSTAPWINYFLRTIIPASIPIFFLVNGYLLFNRPFDLKKHIKRTLRYVLLAFVWAGISRPIYLLIDRQPLTLANLIWPILNLGSEGGMNIYWYLGALVLMYLVFPVLKAAFDFNRKAFVFFTAMCAFFTIGVSALDALVLTANHFLHSGLETFRYPFLEMFNPLRGIYGYSFVYFCAGGLLKEFEPRIRKIPAKKRNSAAVLVMIVACVSQFGLGVLYSTHAPHVLWDLVFSGLGTVFSLFNAASIYLLSLNYRSECKLIRLISANTLGIYFLHTGFYRALTPILKKIPALCNYPATVIYAAVVLLICLGISLLIKKIPILRKLL